MPAALRLTEEQLDEIQRRFERSSVRTHKISDASPTPEPGEDLQEVARIARTIPAKPLDQVLAEIPVLQAKKPRNHRPLIRRAEKHVLRDCLELLERHPKIAFAFRQNTGMAKWRDERTSKERGVRFSFKGCSDILGMFAGGRFLAVECKATGRRATDEQQGFLDNVNEGGGLGICVTDVDQLIVALAAE